MDAREESLNLLNKIWFKLQHLPSANPIELGAFFILLTFMLLVLSMLVLPCVTCCRCCCRCCCCRNARTKGSNI